MQIQLSYNTTRMQLESCPVRHPLHRRREGGGPLDFTRSGSGQRVRQFVNGEARTDRDSDTGGEVRRRPGRARTAARTPHPAAHARRASTAARSTSRFARVRGLRKEVSSENESRLNPQDPHSRTTGRHSSHAGAGAGRTPPISPPAPTPGSDRNHRRNPRHRASPTGGERGRPPHK